MSDFVLSPKGEFTADLVNHDASAGKLTVKAIQTAEGQTTVSLCTKLEHLEAKSSMVSNKSTNEADLFFIIFRADDAVGNTFTNEVYSSEVVHESSEPSFKEVEVPLRDLCLEDPSWQLLVRVMEW